MKYRNIRILLATVLGASASLLPGAAHSAASTVITSTGVITHGNLVNNSNTVGWLMDCEPSHALPDDPIAHPGVPGATHLHDFWGNASTNAGSTVRTQEDAANQTVNDTWNESRVAPGTSCDRATYAPGTAGDTASYWAPALYANGRRVRPSVGSELYYRAKPVFGAGFVPFPQDARLIVGDHSATSAGTNSALVDNHIWWECWGATTVHYQTPPTTCTDIVVNILYPSCYDGGAMDHTGSKGTDNQHFAYPVNGSCVSPFSAKVPFLSEKFKYVIPSTGMNIQLSADPMSPGVLSPAYTMHADFWNTWNPVALQYLVTHCLNARISCGANPITPLT